MVICTCAKVAAAIMSFSGIFLEDPNVIFSEMVISCIIAASLSILAIMFRNELRSMSSSISIPSTSYLRTTELIYNIHSIKLKKFSQVFQHYVGVIS
jgi:hypothetical protein